MRDLDMTVAWRIGGKNLGLGVAAVDAKRLRKHTVCPGYTRALLTSVGSLGDTMVLLW
jgi:hypothetical protein